MRSLGVIDIGSHSIHLEIFDLSRSEPASTYDKSLESHMGRTVGRWGRIPTHLERHLQASLRKLLHKAEKKEVKDIVIVATAGFRKAANGKLIQQRLQKKFDRPIWLLTPQKESELGFLGLRSHLEARSKQLVIDCGGGSTEVSLARGRQRESSKTLPLGATVLALQIKHDPPTTTDVVQIALQCGQHMADLPNNLHPERALVSGGSMEDLLAISSDDDAKSITLREIDRAGKVILQKKTKKIAKRYDLELEDVQNLIPAAVTLSSILKHYQLDRAYVTDKSIRNGIAIAYRRSPKTWWH